ncbi:MAG: hypothetical protein HY303_17565 [Candidatus Wallbacteria bacterium]|nr:hypothetical protein [Candidatus Wallbacteria bacterium]
MIVRPVDDVAPVLSVTSAGSTTSFVGRDLGDSPSTSTEAPLRVGVGALVSLQARASDPDFTAGRQKGLFSWRQTSGSVLRLTQQDLGSSQSRVTFTADTAGVRTFQCRLREADNSDIPLGPEVVKSIRVVVDSPAKKVPQAVVQISPQPRVGSVVTLDGTSSAVSVSGQTIAAYRWVQVLGPNVRLSDPFSPKTTFTPPDLGDEEVRSYAFQLFVERNGSDSLRSVPFVAKVDVGLTLRKLKLPLTLGTNLVSVPFNPAEQGPHFTVADLLQATGASFVAYPGVGNSAKWQAYLPGAGTPAPEVSPTGAYLLQIPGPAAHTLELTGVAWPRARARGYAVRAGLGGVSVPYPQVSALNSDDLLNLLGVGYLIGARDGRFVVTFPAKPGTPAPAFGEGTGFLYEATNGRSLSLESLLAPR